MTGIVQKKLNKFSFLNSGTNILLTLFQFKSFRNKNFLRHGNLSVVSLVLMVKTGIAPITQINMLKECRILCSSEVQKT